MIEIPGRIPVVIHPFFWLFATLIGWISSDWLQEGALWGTLIWVGIIFFSVLFHEYGHALTALCFKQKAQIQLVALGGLTSFDGPKLKFWQQFFITFAGPFFGFILFLFATLLLQYSWGALAFKILKATQIANLFWTVMNLLPVLPLDGGQLLRILLEASFGVKGFKASLLIGSIIAFGICLYFFFIQAFLIGAFFFLFAFQSFDSFRRARFATHDDREEENKQLMVDAEKALQEGRTEEAKQFFSDLREKTKEGILFLAATQYLGFLFFKEGKKEESYQLLLSIKEHLSDDLKPLLHELAAEQKNFALVRELSAITYQIAPTQSAALANARAFAAANEAEHAGGWLQAASQFGGLDIESICREEDFQKVANDPEFRRFLPGS